MIDLNKLEELAKAATPGPWEKSSLGCGIVGLKAANKQWAFASDDSDANLRNAGFSAAANPAAVMELIALIRRQDAELADARGQVENLDRDNHRLRKGTPSVDLPALHRYDISESGPCFAPNDGNYVLYDDVAALLSAAPAAAPSALTPMADGYRLL